MSKLTNKQYEILQEINLPLLLMIEEAEELNSDDEPDAGEEADAPEPELDEEGNEIIPEEEEPPPTEEEIQAMEIQGAQDKFVQFILYDKLSELSSKIDILRENIQMKDLVFDLEFTEKLDQYAQYISVLNELIFSISTTTIYNIVGQLEMEIIQLLEQYIEVHKENEKKDNMEKRNE